MLAIATSPVTEAKVPALNVDPVLTQEVHNLLCPNLPFENKEPTKEFEDPTSDELSDDEWEEVAAAAFAENPIVDDGGEEYKFSDAASDEKCIDMDDDEWDVRACNTSNGQPFEDCASPILHCCVRGTTSVQKEPVRVLVDSGSTLDLISGKMARRLKRLGHEMLETDRSTTIKVANGKRSTLSNAMSLQLILGEEHTDAVDWLVLDDLPFDMILGSETCKKWKGVVDWRCNRFSMSPNGKEIRVDWNV